ncbi:MAG TPA: hypothetical protein VFS10_15350 [Pyrinomonadaceae bacterium]|nr:hypothetical protein [Pyrinomonadaceae bacterium]
MTRFPATRVLLILGALLSLCVSDNVGPRLLPLPPSPELAPAPGLFERGQTASRTTPHGGTEGARVEMASATQNRAGAERQSPQAAARAPKFEIVIPSTPRLLRWEDHPPFAERSTPFSRPEGRAPPRTV